MAVIELLELAQSVQANAVIAYILLAVVVIVCGALLARLHIRR